MKASVAVLLTVLGALAAAGAFVWSGRYDIGADAPHWPPVFELLAAARDRAIEHHAAGVQVPALSAPDLVKIGAEHYAEMCTGCHLAPGMEETEIRQGLYPKPPKLAEVPAGEPAEEFWAIKHGIKFTAMPAWGPTHDDETIWAMVAFLQVLPKMSPKEYAAATGEEHGHAP